MGDAHVNAKGTTRVVSDATSTDSVVRQHLLHHQTRHVFTGMQPGGGRTEMRCDKMDARQVIHGEIWLLPGWRVAVEYVVNLDR